MGSCCSISWTPIGSIALENYEQKEPTDESEYDHHHHHHQPNYIQNGDGARVRFHGSSKFLSMYTQQGKKGINQDSMTSWENFNGENDTYFCGVFDGHGPSGHEVSRIVRDNLPAKLSSFLKASTSYYDGTSSFFSSWENTIIRSFEEMDEELGAAESSVNAYSSGSTAVTVIKKGDHLIISNLGDSRAVLCTRDPNINKLVPVQITRDLKPDLSDESERIRSRKGRIFPMEEEPEVFRVWMPDQDCPGLAMSRSFGDFCLKDFGLIPTPQVSYRKITSNDEFVVLATDGVWDVLTNTEVIKIVGSSRKRSTAARLLVDRAVQAWKFRYPTSKVDDIAVVCLFFKEQQRSVIESMDENELNRGFAEARHGHKKLKSDDGLDTVVNCEVTRTHDRGVTRRKPSHR